MEFGGNTFCLDNNTTNTNRHQNNNSNGNYSWKTVTNNNNNSNSWRVVNALDVAGSAAKMVVQQNGTFMRSHPYGGSHVHPDPHLMCLKLGKRHYFEDATAGSSVVAAAAADKRGKGYSGAGGGAAGFTAAGTTVPRCQVEGCHVALLNAKDYHRRHKVCEMHSKAPKVVVLGMEQRFCQQCSRFHVVSEFDDSKRSCRRRLAGHNERRRKSTQDSVARNSSQGGCALSLLSSSSDSWFSPYDLSTRCSAALRELIAENRAAIMARKFDRDGDWHIHNQALEDFNKKEIQPESNYFPQQMFPQRQ